MENTPLFAKWTGCWNFSEDGQGQTPESWTRSQNWATGNRKLGRPDTACIYFMAFIDETLSSGAFREVSCINSALKGDREERTFPEKNDHQALSNAKRLIQRMHYKNLK